MKKVFILLSILLLASMIFISGCTNYSGPKAQRVNTPKVLSDAEVEELKANYNFEVVGEVQTSTDSQGRKVSTQNFNIVPKDGGTGTVSSGTITCSHSGCSNPCYVAGCVPDTVYMQCSGCWCSDYDGNTCGVQSCTCIKSITKTI